MVDTLQHGRGIRMSLDVWTRASSTRSQLRLISFPLIALLASALCGGCQDAEVDFRPGYDGEQTIGELVYAIAQSNAADAAMCAESYVQTLTDQRDTLVDAVDATITAEEERDLPLLLAESILPGVDNGDLSNFAHTLADVLALSIDDDFDPDRDALEGLASILSDQTVLQDAHVLALVQSVLKDPELTDAIHSIAGLAEEPDENDVAINTAMQLVSSVLDTAVAPGQCEGLADRDVEQTLLRTRGFADDPRFGAPAWVARVDRMGNPKVRIDAKTDTVYPPFTDSDGDGFADTDAQGRLVDPKGNPIDMPPFGKGDAYDDYKRRLAGDGNFLYDYYDAKRTALSQILRLGREALSAGVHRDLATAGDAILGEATPCNDGANCFAYSAENNPLHILLYAMLETAKYDKPVEFVETWNVLLRDNPALADRLLVAIGRIVGALENSDVDFTDPRLFDLMESLIPLVARVFETDAGAAESTPRLLMQVIHELGQTSRDFPDELRLTIDHRTLIKADECGAGPVDPGSPRVDFDRPRYYTTPSGEIIDNRSSLERSMELLVNADCGSVPFTGGKSVTHTLLDLMSDMSPDNVCGLIDGLLGVMRFTGGLGSAVLDGTLWTIGCRDGDYRVSKELQALDDLARSGGLDFYLPLARVFKQQGQMETLIDIIRIVVDDLRLDDDGNPNTASVVRPLLPVVSEVIRAGAVDAFFDLDDLLVTVPAIGGEGSLADVIIDSGVRLMDESGPVMTASGAKPNWSIARELVLGVRLLIERADDARAEDALGRLVSHVAGYITRTETTDVGTPDPSDDLLQLEDRSIVPLLSIVLETASEAARLPRDQYLCYLNQWQRSSQDLVESPNTAAFVRLADLFARYSSAPQLEAFLERVLHPRPGAERLSPYGPLVQIASEFIQAPANSTPIDGLLRLASEALDPTAVDGAHLVRAFDTILQADSEGTMIRVLQNLVAHDDDARTAPIYQLATVVDDVSRIDSAQMCLAEPSEAVSAEDLEELVHTVVDYVRDETYGLEAVFELFRKRSAPLPDP